MNPDLLAEVLSSRARLKIVDAISVRPRTLGELASITGISVQGVLRHLKLLADLGLVGERKLSPRTPRARRVYAARAALFGDYSTAGLTVLKSTPIKPLASSSARKGRDLERMAGELLIQRRRVKDQARRLGRLIEDLVADQVAMISALDATSLGDEERLILSVLLTEETVEDGVRVLSRYYGLEDRRSIDKALAKSRHIVGK